MAGVLHRRRARRSRGLSPQARRLPVLPRRPRLAPPGRRRLLPGEARLRLPPYGAGYRILRSRALAVPLVLSRARSLASLASAAPGAASCGSGLREAEGLLEHALRLRSEGGRFGLSALEENH